MCKKTLFLFQFQLGKGGGILHATSQRDRWSWWSCLIQVVMLWAMQEPKPKRGFLRKSYNELFRCHFLDRSFVSFFGGNIKKKFHDSKIRTRTCAWKKSHLRIKNSWRLFLAGHNHPGQQTFHLYTSPLWLSQGFATFKKGASHRCIQFGVGPETNPRCFQKRCWREGPPGLVVVVGKGKMFNQNMTCLVLGVALSLNLQVINVFFGVI